MTENKATILVVDDEKSVRTILVRKLSGNGYHCLEAENAEQLRFKH